MESLGDFQKPSSLNRMLEFFKSKFMSAPAETPLEYSRPAPIVPIAQDEKWDAMEKRKSLAQGQQATSLPENIIPFPQAEPPKGA